MDGPHNARAIARKKRKHLEECFGWLNTIALRRKVCPRGAFIVQWLFSFSCAACNLVRVRNLMVATAPAR
jgi:hypothetical protein